MPNRECTDYRYEIIGMFKNSIEDRITFRNLKGRGYIRDEAKHLRLSENRLRSSLPTWPVKKKGANKGHDVRHLLCFNAPVGCHLLAKLLDLLHPTRLLTGGL
jgi:hypothetical protein